MNIKTELETQLKEIERRCGYCDDFTEWATLQVAKSNILLALQKYEAKPLRDREENTAIEQHIRDCRKTIQSMQSEIKYALYSNKSNDVKEHYLKNAERYADEILEKINAQYDQTTP